MLPQKKVLFPTGIVGNFIQYAQKHKILIEKEALDKPQAKGKTEKMGE